MKKFIFVILMLALFANIAYTRPLETRELNSPFDHIKEHQIKVFNDEIRIKIKGATLARYIDSNSMDPLIDKDATGIEIIPENPNQIHIGDIVAYKSNLTKSLIVHRIQNVSKDNQGLYYTLKGDNNENEDPEKVRFSQIKYLLIGVIY
jgi:signal peptidase I